MKPGQQQDDQLARFVFSLNLSGLTMTKVILWLIAITIVSFSIGFVILAISGGLFPGTDAAVTPFNNTAFRSSNASSFPLEGASSGEVRIVLGTGDLSIRSGTGQDNLMETTVYSARPEMQPDYAVSMNGSAKTVAMTETGHKKKDWVFTHAPDSWKNSWDVNLNTGIPFVMVVNTGAGDCDIHAGDLNLTSLSVNTGVGDTMIDLGGYHGGRFSAVVHNGVGDLTLRIPKTSNTRILLHQGVGDLDTSGIVQTDDYYTPARFNTALPANEITITQGVGSIKLEAV